MNDGGLPQQVGESEESDFDYVHPSGAEAHELHCHEEGEGDDEDEIEFEDLDLGEWNHHPNYLLAQFPIVPDTMIGVLSLMSIKCVKTLVSEWFYENNEICIRYPERGKTLPGQHKACTLCGRLGHNSATHTVTLGLSAEATRHVLSLMKHGETIQPEEVVRQIELVLGALAGIASISQKDDSPIVMRTLGEIKMLYDNILSWVTNPCNRHARHVRLISEFDRDTEIIFKSSTAGTGPKIHHRSTTLVVKALIHKSKDKCCVPQASAITVYHPGYTQLFLFPDNSVSLENLDVHQTVLHELSTFFQNNPDADRYRAVSVGHRFHCPTLQYTDVKCSGCGSQCNSTFGAEFDVTTYAACKRCRLLGHISNVCDTRTPGSKVVLCLATLLDVYKQHRLDHIAVRRSLVNCHRIIMALAYRFWVSGGVEDELSEIHLDRITTPPGKPALQVLMRLYNYAVCEILEHSLFSRHIHLQMKMNEGTYIDIGSAGTEAERIPEYTQELRKTVLGVLAHPDKLPRFIQETQTHCQSPSMSYQGMTKQRRTLVGLSTSKRPNVSGLEELAEHRENGLTEEELANAAIFVLTKWNTPHLSSVISNATFSCFDMDWNY